jgi:hypothetical protein
VGKIKVTCSKVKLIPGGPFSMIKTVMRLGTGKKAGSIPEKLYFTRSKSIIGISQMIYANFKFL